MTLVYTRVHTRIDTKGEKNLSKVSVWYMVACLQDFVYASMRPQEEGRIDSLGAKFSAGYELDGQTTVTRRVENVSVNSMLRACEKVIRRETDDFVVCCFQYSTSVSAQVKTIEQEGETCQTAQTLDDSVDRMGYQS